MGHHGKRGCHFGKDLQQLVVDLDEPEVRDTLRSVLRHADGPNRGIGSTSTQPAGQDRCEAADVKLRPCVLLVIAERAFPLPIRAYPRQRPACDCADQCVSVQRAQRHRCAEDLPEMSLSFGHRRLHRLVRVKVGQAESKPTFLACLDHERVAVAILSASGHVHRAAHCEIGQHGVYESEQRIVFGFLHWVILPPRFRIGLRQALLLLDRRGSQRSLLSVRRTWLALVLMLAACGGPSRDSALPLTPTPATALATCLKIGVMRAVCPRRVPLLRGGPVVLVAGCLDSAGALVPVTSKRCRSAGWSVMGDPPIPAFIGHIVISASFDDPQCDYPREVRGSVADDALLSRKRRQAVLFGHVRWYGQPGELVLAPPYFAGGGEVGDHLEFCFRADGIYYAITIHSWSPLAQVVATLKEWVRSTLGG